MEGKMTKLKNNGYLFIVNPNHCDYCKRCYRS